MRSGAGFPGSIVSYPDRGPDGNARYRGNTSGYLIEDFLRLVHTDANGIFADVMCGGNTSGDVAKRLSAEPAFAGIAENYRGLDLRDGFDASRDDLLTELGREAHSIFLHPPYFRMLQYSARMWGTEAHPDDLSQLPDLDDFLSRLQAVLQNVYQGLERGGHYGLLLGNWRTKGVYHHLPALILPLCPGELREEIIKVQNNCTSDRRTYSGNLVTINHETLLIFRRGLAASSFYIALETLDRLQRYEGMTWRNLVYSAFRRNEVKTLSDVYAVLQYHPKAQKNRHYQAKIRQQVQSDKRLERIAAGTYRAVA